MVEICVVEIEGVCECMVCSLMIDILLCLGVFGVGVLVLVWLVVSVVLCLLDCLCCEVEEC